MSHERSRNPLLSIVMLHEISTNEPDCARIVEILQFEFILARVRFGHPSQIAARGFGSNDLGAPSG